MKKKIFLVAGTVGSIPVLALPVLAESTGTANQAVVSAMTNISNDMIATANSIIPVALTTVGLSIVVVFGIRIFKRVMGK